MTRLSSGYRPGQRCLGTAQAWSAALAVSNPNINFVCLSDCSEWDHVVGTSIQQYEITLLLGEDVIVSLSTNSVDTQHGFVDPDKNLYRDLATLLVVFIGLLLDYFLT
jgi:hypothetical protein